MHGVWYWKEKERSVGIQKNLHIRKVTDSESKITVQSSEKSVFVENLQNRRYNKAKVVLHADSCFIKRIEWKQGGGNLFAEWKNQKGFIVEGKDPWERETILLKDKVSGKVGRGEKLQEQDEQ